MQTLIFLSFFVQLFLTFPLIYAAPISVSITAESAILMNADTGAILYEKKAHQKMYPASVTKIATAAYVLKVKENELDKMVSAEQECIGSVSEEAKQRSNYSLPSYWLVTDCSHMGIKRGETLSIRDLLHGMLIASADDASNILAHEVAGDIPKFMEQLNQYLKELGCKNTHFNNPHGLHHPKHVTTAYDLALMTRNAMKHPLFREIVLTKRFTRPKTNKQESSVMVQTNRLLRTGEHFYSKAIGVKTGRTSKAGNTFVAAAKEGDRTLIAVLLNVKERKDIFKESVKLFEAAFNQPKIEKIILKKGPQKYRFEAAGAKSPIDTYLENDIALSYYPAEEPTYKAFITSQERPLPIKKGDKVGEIVLKDSVNKILTREPLLALNDVEPSFSFRLKEFFTPSKNKPIFIAVGVGALFLVAAFYFSRRR